MNTVNQIFRKLNDTRAILLGDIMMDKYIHIGIGISELRSSGRGMLIGGRQ
jgi:hypothetical protein